ncbi:sugar phosphate isomerase/epimerase [Puniceicoccaceae bacterium K14]|nr:sugar phosphate isomerase/epimerase [Puniceicoccaceae bacterium K14]
MLKTGICSISFGSLSPEELVKLVSQSGLDSIEWASNVHVPFGDAKFAESIRKLTEDAGLSVSSYGSYYKVVDEEGKPLPFEPVIESALALGTDTVRIWAGHQPSDGLSEAERAVIVENLRIACEAAQSNGLKLGLEFHANTLSDSNGATMELLKAVDHPSLYTYWQPIYWLTDPAYRMDGLRQLASKILNLHVFQWVFRPGAGSWGESTDRRPLKDGEKEWLEYLKVDLDESFQHYALMEFVRNDTQEQFLEDAKTLKSWVS